MTEMGQNFDRKCNISDRKGDKIDRKCVILEQNWKKL